MHTCLIRKVSQRFLACSGHSCHFRRELPICRQLINPAYWQKKYSLVSYKRGCEISATEGMDFDWDLTSCLQGENTALVMLNTPLSLSSEEFSTLWAKAKLKSVTDGALNRLDKLAKMYGMEFLPDFVSGDFDSVKPELIETYKHKGVQIRNTPDQNATDFTKNLRLMCDIIKSTSIQVNNICVLLTFSGRLDHIMAVVNTLYLHQAVSNIPVYLYSGDSVSWLLPKGKHRISVTSGREGDWCGLIPVGGATVCTTSGLKWNLDEDTMQFGKIISTSNQLDGSSHVTVETDQPLLWTCGLKEF